MSVELYSPMIRELARSLHFKPDTTTSNEDPMDVPGTVTIEPGEPYTELGFAMTVSALLELADYLDANTDHFVVFRRDDITKEVSWSVQHSIECRENNPDMTECEIHRQMEHEQYDLVHLAPGRYKVIWETDDDGNDIDWILEKVEPKS
jgi:hypothetical protein